MSAELRDPAFADVVGGADLNVEQVATGFEFTEGPIWHPYEKHLTFSDIPNNQMRRWTPDGTVSMFRNPSNKTNGNTYDRQGRMLSCEHATSRVTRTAADGTITVLASHYNGQELNSPNDIVVKSDGRIYFTDSTKRYDAHDWALDSIENRATGRLLVYDPKDGSTKTLLDGYRYTNGVCMAHDGKSLFFAESWACRVHRYWLEGPKAGTAECVIKDMPGYPDNINRASDGNYWMAWLGMRTPSFDLSLRHPDMRKRMTRRLPQDEWLFPNINTGGVVKFSETGQIVDTLGDLTGNAHPMVTSMREHKGYLFVGGILNNRIGRFRIAGADEGWTSPASYWGGAE